jgi:YesN/AraC family two-component response regulator
MTPHSVAMTCGLRVLIADDHAIVCEGLKQIIKMQNITTFNIATTASDGSRLFTVENAKNHGGLSKLP